VLELMAGYLRAWVSQVDKMSSDCKKRDSCEYIE